MSLFFSFNPCAFQKKSFSLIFLICTYLDFPNDLDFASLFLPLSVWQESLLKLKKHLAIKDCSLMVI